MKQTKLPNKSLQLVLNTGVKNRRHFFPVLHFWTA